MNVGILNSPNTMVEVVKQFKLPPPCPTFAGEQMTRTDCVLVLMVDVDDVDVLL